MTTIPAFTIGGLTRPELHLDPTGHIILDPAAQAFVDLYGLQRLYLGCPPGTPFPPVQGFLSAPTDINSTANNVIEGAAVNTLVGLTAHADSLIGFPVTYSLTNNANGAFKIDSHTGVVSVADPTKVDFESSGGNYGITVRATDGIFVSSQNFSVAVTNAPPLKPFDYYTADTPAVYEGAAAGTVAGIDVFSFDVNGPAIIYSLTADTSNGGFKIDAVTGIVTVADPSKLNYESAPGGFYVITVQASDGHGGVSSQNFSIAVYDVAPAAPVDTDAAPNTVAEGAAVGTPVGLTVHSDDISGGAVAYALIDDANGAFKVDPNTGVVTVADPSKIDYESAPGHSLTITALVSDGTLVSTQTFTIAVTNAAPSTPTDSDASANTVAEGAVVGTVVGVTAAATDVNGGALTWTLTNNAGGAFTIDPATGVITVADPTKIDYETAPGHAYTVTAQASDGTLTSSQDFTIAVTNVAPSVPVDSNAAANAVAEGAAAGTLVGVTASATDVNGPALTYSIAPGGDSSGGGFAVDPTTGVITVADPTKIDYESSPGHAYTVTVQASDGALTNSQTFTISVNDVVLGAPADVNPAANSVVEGAANGTAVGITASAIDPNGPATTYALTDNAGGRFAIDPNSGIVTVANSGLIDYETAPGHAYGITVQATNAAVVTSKNFSIGVTDAAPSAPVDNDGAVNSVVEGAAAGTLAGITAHATDVNGGTVTYSLIGNAHGFTINATTGVISVADPSQIDFETAPGGVYQITAQASDGTLPSTQTFTIAVTDVAPSTPVDNNPAANSIIEGAAAGTAVGITASATDINGPAVTWSILPGDDSSGGGFAIDPNTGVITVADPTKIDYETAAGHAYTVKATASDGTLTSSQTFTIAVANAAPSTPVDSNAAADSVAEGAAVGTTVGVTASSTDVNGPAVTWSIAPGDDSSGGGFAIDPTTGVITVADPTKLNYESAPGHAYTVTATASDGLLTSTHTFTIAVTDVAPSTPIDTDGATNTVAEGAAAGTAVGITASAVDVNGPAVTWSIAPGDDSSGGGFAIDPNTGVITVADPSKINYETAAGHVYTVTATASDGTLTSTHAFTIAVTNVAPSTPVDSDAAPDQVAEGAAVGTAVGITASSTDINGPAVTWSIAPGDDSSGGGFAIDPNTGVITVADPTKINYETAPGHAYTVTATASDGTATSTHTFTIGVTDVAPSTPVDSDNGTDSVAEGAAVGTAVGITASSTDVNGPAVTWSIAPGDDSSGGGFAIDPNTGVITVADPTKINYESAPGHAYTVTATASDGTLTSTHTFTIAVTDVPPSVPVDSDLAAANQVAISAPAGTYVGLTASSTDVNGPAVTYSIVAGSDTSGGGFAIDPNTGKVTVADPSKILAADPSYNITIDASDGTQHNQQTFTIAVVLDAAPVVTAGHTLNYTENQAATAFDPAITVTDSDNANLTHATVQISGGYVNGEDVLAFANTATITGSFNAATGTLTLTGTDTVANYQAALAAVTYHNTSDNPSGATRTVTIIANDGTLDSTPVTDTINVTPVNDPPQVVAGHTLNYTENQSATAIDPAITVSDLDNATLTGATVQITGNYAGSQDVLGFVNTANITGAFNAGTGTLTLSGTDTVAAYQAALASVTYFNSSENPSGLARTVTIIANDGTANSTPVTDTINVTPVNDAPVTTAGGTLNYTENQAATAIDPTVIVTDVDSANLTSATVTISGGYVNGQDILGFSTQNGISGVFNAGTGTLMLTGSSSVANYKTALDSVTYFNNSDNPSGADRTISYQVNDGALNSNISTSTIHVTPVNDAPTVTATGTLAYTENQGATAIAPALTVTDPDTATLTTASVQISTNYVSGEDLLAFTNTANITGSFNAGTGTLTLTGTDTVANYEAALRSVTYTDTSENPSTLARTVTFTADDGQAANHLGAGSNHTINVTSVDDAPVNNSVPSNFTVMSGFTHAVTGLSISDVDAGSATDITTTFTAGAGTVVIGNGTSGGTAGIAGGATITTNGTGAVVLTGSLAQINTTLGATNGVVYTAADNAGNTTSTLQMATNDHGHTGTGGPITDTDTINIGVIPQVWFINQDQSAIDSNAPRGSQANPFSTAAEFNASSGPGVNDYIYVKAGTYSGDGINLKAGQTLLGDDQALSFANPLGGAPIVIEDATGARPTINVTTASDQGIALASGNTVAGIIVTTGASSTVGIDDSGASVGTLNISDTDVTGGGQAINITHGGTGGTVALGTVSSTGGTTGIALGGALVTNFSATGGTLSGHSSSEFNVNGGTGNISYGGSIGDGSGLSASVSNHTGGTVGFSGSITDGADAGGGVALSNNTGGTVNFTGGMTLNTGASNGFVATGGGTVNVTGANNHLTSTTGTALNISNTTIGASNVTFRDISANGGANGIILDTTGSSGGLHVTGDGSTAGSGGHIQNMSGADGSNAGVGVYLNSTKDLQLAFVHLNDFQNYGILGNAVNGMTLDHVVVDGSNGTSVSGLGEGDVYLTGLTGSASVSSSSFTGAAYDSFHVFNNNGETLNRITISGSTFATNAAAGNLSNDALVFQATNGTFNATVQGSTFTSARGDLFQLDLHGGVSSDLVFGGSTGALGNTLTNNNQNIVSGGGGVTISSGGAGDHASLTFNIAHNTMRDALGTALGISSGSGTGSFNGTIDSNTIGVAGVANSGSVQGNDIGFVTMGGAPSSVTITNNNVFQYGNGAAILVQNGDHVDGGNSLLTAIVQGNTVSNPGSFGSNGFLLNAGTVSGDAATVALTLGGPGALANNFAGSGGGGATDVRLRDRFDVKVGLHAGGGANYAGGPTDSAAITSFVQANNNGSPTVSIVTGNAGTSGFFGSPLLAADGGVAALIPTAGETHLTQAELNTIVTAAIAQWAHAGATSEQLAAMLSTTFSVSDIGGDVVGDQTAGHITIDDDAAGHGWFVDPTPADNSEFTHAVNGSSTDFLTDPTNTAAGHLDLLTTVAHELGHVIGLDDTTSASDLNGLMHVSLVDGERRLPSAADVALANQSNFSFAAIGSQAPAAVGAGSAHAAAGDAGHAAGTSAWGNLADLANFVFAHADPSQPINTTWAVSLINHSFDFSGPGSDAIHAAAVQALGTLSELFSGLTGSSGAPSQGTAADHSGLDVASIAHLLQAHHDLVV
jgi:hypothetical protein